VRGRVGPLDGRVTPPFPGGVGLSHLRVYDTTAPDGLAGGTPHLHTVCTEAYAVVSGRGSVQTLTASGSDEVPLEPGAFVWFTPGTIHRLVNGGGLEILVLMQNAGLPEAGDMVITFPPDVLAAAATYEAAAVLPDGERTTAGTGAAARARRDLAVPAFNELRRATEAGDAAPLRAFHEAAARLVQPHVADWTARWRAGPLREVERTGDLLRALAEGDPDHLADAGVHRLPPPAEERRMGCCGTLGTFLP
jgi:mannose-6-phosphate isomerase-like protein (cupin superfamily)